MARPAWFITYVETYKQWEIWKTTPEGTPPIYEAWNPTIDKTSPTFFTVQEARAWIDSLKEEAKPINWLQILVLAGVAIGGIALAYYIIKK